MRNTDKTRTICVSKEKGLAVEFSKPFVFFHELVAGVRFELTTFGL
jgi:hypothetical protein